MSAMIDARSTLTSPPRREVGAVRRVRGLLPEINTTGQQTNSNAAACPSPDLRFALATLSPMGRGNSVQQPLEN